MIWKLQDETFNLSDFFNMKRYTIGIDGGRTTGVAVFDRQTRTLSNLTTTDYFGCRAMLATFRPDECDVIVEDPSQVHPVFQRPLKEPVTERQAHLIQMKIAQAVGAVKQQTALLIEELRRMGFNVIAARPMSRAKKAKNDARQFALRTGWVGSTNQHVRDAGMLCYGVMSCVQLLKLKAQPAFLPRARTRRK
jgi:hypothetical protein